MPNREPFGRRFGCHLGLEDGLEAMARRATELGAEAVQVFTRDPRKGPAAPFEPAALATMRSLLDHQGVAPLVVHLPYFGNLAHPEPEGSRRAQQLVLEELERSAELGAAYLVFHPGHWGKGSSLRPGLLQVTRNLAAVLTQWNGPVRLLIENTSGHGREIGHRLKDIGQLLRDLAAPAQLGVCLDTCHLYAAGYPVNWGTGIALVLEQVEAAFGVDQVYLVHANDTADPQGSRRDRHAAPGSGEIGEPGFRELLATPLGQVPWLAETRDPAPDLAFFRRLAGSSI